MKKTLIIAVIALAAFTSCKKDRNCTCTDGKDSSTTTYLKVTKAQGKANCYNYSYTYNKTTTDITCTLE